MRGSTGYGREYMMLDDVERRMDSVADLKACEWLHGRRKLRRTASPSTVGATGFMV